MLCPNCGTKTTTENKFCRNCGMNLEPVVRALAAHLTHGGTTAVQAAREAERQATRRMMNGLVAGVVVVIFGVLMAAFLPGKAFKFLGVASTLIGLITAMVSVIAPLRTAGGAGVGPLPHALDHSAPNTGRLLHEQTFDPVPSSVTDHTTELLNVEAKSGKARRGN